MVQNTEVEVPNIGQFFPTKIAGERERDRGRGREREQSLIKHVEYVMNMSAP